MHIDVNMGAVYTAVFLNHHQENPIPTVWVFGSQVAFEWGMEALRRKKHIEILQSGPSHVYATDTMRDIRSVS